MSPKPGTPVTLVPPIAPPDALEADQAQAGEVGKFASQTAQKEAAQFDAVKIAPHKPPATQAEKEEKPSWIEIELVDMDNQPVPGARYRITLPDGTADEGTLDGEGFARVDGFEPGNCDVTFPDLDGEAWEKI